MSKTRNLSDLLDANGDVKSTALDNVPASDVVNDTTPQLGGNLDSNGNSITLPDSTGALVNRLRFGNSADLTIYHDGSNSYIDDNGTGDFIIRARDLAIKSITDENHIVCVENGSTSLYHDNSKKLETSSSGATVTGTLSATAFSGDGSALTGVGGSNTPNFFVSKSSDQSITGDGTNTKITFDTEVFDSDGAFASSRFTVPSGEAGKYFFSGVIRFEGDSPTIDYAQVLFYKNGTRIYNGGQTQTYADYMGNYHQNYSVLLDLSVGDYIEVYGAISGSNTSIGGSGSLIERSYFQGFKLIG